MFKPPLKGKNTERLPALKQGYGSAADCALEFHMPVAASLLWEHAQSKVLIQSDIADKDDSPDFEEGR